MEEQNARFGCGDQLVGRARLEPVADWRQRRAERRRCEQRFEKRRMVRTEPDNPISSPDPKIAEPIRQAAYAPGEIRVGATPVSEDDGRPFGGHASAPFDPRPDVWLACHRRLPCGSETASEAATTWLLWRRFEPALEDTFR